MTSTLECAENLPSVGIIGAMDVEVELLRGQLTERVTSERAGIVFDRGCIERTPVVIARCGVGKVSAALCVQAMVDLFGVGAIINTGVAGSLDASINIGDLVVATDALEHDMDVTALGYEPGQVPGLAVRAFEASTTLRSAIVAAAAAAAPEIGVFEGRVASGDQFVANNAVKARIAKQFGALCCEMEGAAIAQACWLNGVPFAVVRAISDKADGSDVMDYPVFEEQAARRCAAIVHTLLASYPRP